MTLLMKLCKIMVFELVFNSKLAEGNGIRHIGSGRKSSTSVCRSVGVKIHYDFFDKYFYMIGFELIQMDMDILYKFILAGVIDRFEERSIKEEHKTFL